MIPGCGLSARMKGPGLAAAAAVPPTQARDRKGEPLAPLRPEAAAVAAAAAAAAETGSSTALRRPQAEAMPAEAAAAAAGAATF